MTSMAIVFEGGFQNEAFGLLSRNRVILGPVPLGSASSGGTGIGTLSERMGLARFGHQPAPELAHFTNVMRLVSTKSPTLSRYR